MEDVRRWSVTYTKHVKQKRKVYQDGILELHSSGHKVMLYGDCDKLLDSRFVKLDDVVRSGETLTFGAYLVDIGDPHGDYKSIPNLNFQGREKKITDRGGLLHGKDKKSNSGTGKASLSNLSPSQKIIREFKKSQANKYCGSPSCPDTTKTNSIEWQVLYTTQLTQKAKKFHDGFLRLTFCGSQGRQVMLYDTTRRLLDSRFLKKDGIIRSGESLTFDGHLVDIGECEGDDKPLMDLNVEGRNCNVVAKADVLHGGQSQTQNNNPVEWDAMYTTQVNQKTKKYHSGIIRLVSCGSYRMQATLLTEDGTALGRRYLKLSEDVSSGSTFQLPNYLVEIGEPRKYPEGEPQNKASALKDEDLKVRRFDVDNIKLGRRVPANRPLCDGEHQNSASPLHDTDSKVRSCGADKVKTSWRVPTNKPMRDAHAILSILKKPNTQEGMVTIKGAFVEECHASQSSDFGHSDIQNQEQGQPVQVSCNKRTEVEDLDDETSRVHNYTGVASKSKPVHNDLSKETIISANTENRGDTQVLGVFSVDSDGPLPTEPYEEQNENVDFGGYPEVMSSKAASTLNFNQLSEEVKHEITPQVQPSGDNMVINSRSRDKVFGCCITTSSEGISHDTSSDGKKSSEENTNSRTTDVCPSFDLGF